MSKYKVGDMVWAAHAGTKEVVHPCPVCFEKRIVTLILGNGDSVELPCDYCRRGYDNPTGYKTEYEYTSGAIQETIKEIRSSDTGHGVEVEYVTIGSRLLKESEVFDSERGAIALSETWREKENEDKRTRAEYIKADVKKTYSWNAGYHLREAKREEESAARHRERAKLCKAKAKEE